MLNVNEEKKENAQVIERIEQIRAESNLSQRKFVDRLGYQQRGYSGMVQNSSRPPVGLILAVAKHFGVRPTWLLTGETPKFESEVAHVADEAPGLLMLPLYGARAGAGNERFVLSEEPEKLLAFREDWIKGELRRNPDNLFLLTVVGDSMYPTMVPGEVVLVDRTENQPAADAIYLMRVGEGIMVKRLQWGTDRRLHVISDNSQYREMVIGPDDLHNGVAILGRVIWGGRRY